MRNRNNGKNNSKNSSKARNKNNSRRASAGALAMWTAMAVAVLAASIVMQGTTVYADEGKAQADMTCARVRSNGRVRYEYAVIDGDDLTKIDAYISEKKNVAAGILVRLGTKFRQQSGEYVYDRNPDAGQGDIDPGALSWTMLAQAAKESQNVPAGMAVLNPEAALHIEGVEERTDFYVTATEDNLSKGKAAWVDGRLLLGNGADNDRAYRQGITDGGQGNIPENLHPIYGAKEVSAAIGHEHVGTQEEIEGVSGCYHNYSVTSQEVFACDLALKYCEVTWHPNENEPGGGTYHGGFYTCSHHGGQYDSPGICTYEKVIIRTEWMHDVICGQESVIYARLTVKAADTEQQEGQLCLNAVLEKGEGYDRLKWKEGDNLIWTDNRGNVLGAGPELMVFEPGIYRCGINVANADIDRRMAEAAVTVSGLMMSGN